jgi:ATP-binding cassette, subfamily B, multidrug efflux pump
MILIYKYLKKYWGYAVLAPVLMLIEVVCDLLQPNLLAKIVDQGIAHGNISLIIQTGLTMIGVAIIGMIGGFGCTIAASIASQNAGTDIRYELFTKVQSFSFSTFDRFSSSSLLTRLTNDVVQVQNLIMMLLRIFVRAPLLCLGGIVMAVSLNAKLSLILVVIIPVVGITLYIIMKKGLPLFTKVQVKLDRVNQVVQENLSAMRVVKAFVREKKEKKRFHTANKDLRDMNVKAFKLMVITMPIMMLCVNLSVVAILWFGGIQVNAGSMQIGQIMAYINYMTQILIALMMITFLLLYYSRAQASANRINEVLETKINIVNISNPILAPIEKGSVRFDSVSFHYQQSPPILKDISFSVQEGETVGIIGGTGSGKTTLLQLIPRLYEVSGGSISIQNQNVKNYDLTTLRQSIGFVLQNTILFSGTILENLKWGNQAASIQEVEEVCRIAQAHDFIQQFPQGYNTMLGQKGVNLSGGQKQRIAIARALLKKPVILLLDDSTSAVDTATEAKIQKNLKSYLRSTTTFIVAQRVNSIMNADKIIVLEEGRIASTGNHLLLMKESLLYQDIYRSQIQEGVTDEE